MGPNSPSGDSLDISRTASNTWSLTIWRVVRGCRTISCEFGGTVMILALPTDILGSNVIAPPRVPPVRYLWPLKVKSPAADSSSDAVICCVCVG